MVGTGVLGADALSSGGIRQERAGAGLEGHRAGHGARQMRADRGMALDESKGSCSQRGRAPLGGPQPCAPTPSHLPW